MKKPIKQKSQSSSTVMISLLKEIKNELIIERKNKLKNALILATAIVMFAVPLNFMVEISANYIDSSFTGGLDFWNWDTPYYWLFFICIIFVFVGFSSFFIPMSRIFMDSFDWETVFRDIEEENKTDEYFIDPTGEECWVCNVCDDEFPSERQAIIHEEECEVKK